MPEQDAFDFAKGEATASALRIWHWFGERLRTFLTVKLAVVSAATIGVAVAAWFAFPVAVALAFGACAIFLVLWAVQSQRLLHRRRALGRWDAIDGLRAKQQEVTAKAALREAALAICGGPGDRQFRFGIYPPLGAAVRYAEAGRRDETASQARPRRQDSAPQVPALTQARRELEDLREQGEMLEARIQALAAPGSAWERAADETAERWTLARAADAEARRRARRAGSRPPPTPAWRS